MFLCKHSQHNSEQEAFSNTSLLRIYYWGGLGTSLLASISFAGFCIQSLLLFRFQTSPKIWCPCLYCISDALRTVYTSILQLEIRSSWYRCHTQWSLCNSLEVFQYFTDKTILCNKQLNNLSAEARNSAWKQEVLPLKRNTLPVSTAENMDCAVFWFLKLLCFIFSPPEVKHPGHT